MKNLLLENMLRFGTKNLTEADVEKLNNITSLNEGYITGEYKGKRINKDIGYLQIAEKAKVKYKGDLSRLSGDDRITVRLNAPAKTANIVYRLEVYPQGVKKAFGNLFPRGGTLVVDKLVKSGDRGNRDFPNEIPINQSVTFKGSDSVVRTNFNFPMPLPGALVTGNAADPKSIKISFETSTGTAGYLGYAANYTMKARIIYTVSRADAETSITNYFAKNPNRPIKIDGKELKDVAAYMADWDARNPSGTSTGDNVVNLSEGFFVSIKTDAIPIAPATGRN